MLELTKEQLRKLQLVELDILKEFDRICKKHSLKYTLCGGTLIGAIRHDGFIPWDDDIDVAMERDEYEKFIKIQEKELNRKKYYFQSIETDDKYLKLHSNIRRKNSVYSDITLDKPYKEQGMSIDIFPIDKIKNNSIFSKIYYYKTFILKIILMYKGGYIKSSNDKKKNKLVKYIKFISVFYKTKSLKSRVIRRTKKYNNRNTEYLTCYAGVYGLKEIFNSSHFNKGYTSHIFENDDFMILTDYDNYLKHYYGNYMKLPPKDKQIGHHFTGYIKFPDEE